MKTLIVILLSCYLVILLIGIFAPVVFAQEKLEPEKTSEEAKKTEEKTAPASTSTGNYGLSAVEGTPKGLLYEVFIKIATFIMGIVGIVLVAMIIYGGVLYMASAGNEKQTETAKRVITYAIIGVVIIFASYVIAKFVIGAVG